MTRPLLIAIAVLLLTNVATGVVAQRAVKQLGQAEARVAERDRALAQAAADYLALDVLRASEHAQLAERERQRQLAAHEARQWERAYQDAIAAGSREYQECRAVLLPGDVAERLRTRTYSVPD